MTDYIQDANLSLRAKGLLATMATLNGEITMQDLVMLTNDSEKTIYSTLLELVAMGYSVKIDTKAEKPKMSKNHVPYDEIVALYNDICGSKGFPKVAKLTNTRRGNIRGRWKEYPDLEKFKTVFTYITESEWCQGKNPSGWKADFDFAVAQSKFPRILEGFYNHKKTEPQKPTPSFNKASFFESAIRRTEQSIKERTANGKL